MFTACRYKNWRDYKQQDAENTKKDKDFSIRPNPRRAQRAARAERENWYLR